jgi:hypothetical protein
MANPPDARQPAMPQVGDQRLLQALTTEHFTLQTARSATIMETNGRSALFLSTVSSAVVALAFIGQVADVGQPFFLFALAVLPALFVLGLLTYLRLVQRASEDLLYPRAINRIRRFYLELDPAAPSWFLLGGHDDIHGATANMGLVPSSRHLLSHTATMVAATASMIGGVFVALAGGGLGAGRVPVTVAAAAGGPGECCPHRGTLAGPGPAVARRGAERAIHLPIHARLRVTSPGNGCPIPRRRRRRSTRPPIERKGSLTCIAVWSRPLLSR